MSASQTSPFFSNIKCWEFLTFFIAQLMQPIVSEFTYCRLRFTYHHLWIYLLSFPDLLTFMLGENSQGKMVGDFNQSKGKMAGDFICKGSQSIIISLMGYIHQSITKPGREGGSKMQKSGPHCQALFLSECQTIKDCSQTIKIFKTACQMIFLKSL